jgi:prepilin-type processing-associated H-X9-DG protein
VVIAIIAILAGILLPTLAASKEKARAIICKNNARQIGLALLSYVHDDEEAFPLADTGMDGDWVQWNGGPSNRSFTSYLGGINTNLFRCPRDAAFKERETKALTGRYPFSYSLSNSRGLFKKQGMASIFSSNTGIVPFKLNMIKHPSEKIMIAEDIGASDYPGLVDPFSPIYLYFNYTSFFWTSPFQEEQNGEQLTKRHSGRANVAFPDGHVDTVKQSFGDQRRHTDPLL